MIFKFPKNDKNFRWTQHVKDKMLFYRISEQKIKTILKNPDRREEGIAPNTIAVMKRNDTPKRKEELWVMYAANVRNVGNDRNVGNERAKRSSVDHQTSSRFVMISAWRYPGISKSGRKIYIPEDTLAEIQKNWL